MRLFPTMVTPVTCLTKNYSRSKYINRENLSGLRPQGRPRGFEFNIPWETGTGRGKETLKNACNCAFFDGHETYRLKGNQCPKKALITNNKLLNPIDQVVFIPRNVVIQFLAL